MSGEIDANNLVPLRQRHVCERGVLLQTGVVDQHVDRAEGIDHFFEHGLHIGLVRDVSANRNRLDAARPHFGDNGLRRVVTGDVIDHDISTSIGEGMRNAASNPRAGAGDQGFLPQQHLLRRYHWHDWFGQVVEIRFGRHKVTFQLNCYFAVRGVRGLIGVAGLPSADLRARARAANAGVARPPAPVTRVLTATAVWE